MGLIQTGNSLFQGVKSKKLIDDFNKQWSWSSYSLRDDNLAARCLTEYERRLVAKLLSPKSYVNNS